MYLLYDDIMSLKSPEGVQLICYADDLAVSICAKDPHHLQIKGNCTLYAVHLWMERNSLEIAPEKTVAIVLGNRRRTGIVFEINGVDIVPENRVTYLGMVLDRNLNFGTHLETVCEKARKTTKALSALLPNIRGPKMRKRKVLAMTVQSVVLYASPIWADAMKIERHRKTVESVQRLMALRVCSGYRTVSTAAVLVVSGLIPLNLLAMERMELFKLHRPITPEDRKAARDRTYHRWQCEWEQAQEGRWTFRLIRDVKTWTDRRHGEIDYFMTQCITGHGCFMKYVHKIRKRNNSSCLYCSSEDDAEHTMFTCHRWYKERKLLEMSVGRELTPENMIDIILQKKKNWEAMRNFAAAIITQKDIDERRAQQIEGG